MIVTKPIDGDGVHSLRYLADGALGKLVPIEHRKHQIGIFRVCNVDKSLVHAMSTQLFLCRHEVEVEQIMAHAPEAIEKIAVFETIAP